MKMLAVGAQDIMGEGREQGEKRNDIGTEARMSALNATIRYRSRNYFRFSINSRMRASVQESVPLTVSFQGPVTFEIPYLKFPQKFSGEE